MKKVWPAEEKHIPDLLRLLVQVNMVHHNGRPDLFKGPATKYDASQLAALLRDPGKRPEAFMDLRELRKEIRAVCCSTELYDDSI